MGTLTTPKFAIPWPDGTERVMDGDNAMGAIANKVDGLGIAFAHAAGTVSIVATTVASASAAVTFPVGRFTQVPLVLVSIATNTANWFCASAPATTAGFTAWILQRDGTTATGTVPVNWHALQMLPGASPG